MKQKKFKVLKTNTIVRTDRVNENSVTLKHCFKVKDSFMYFKYTTLHWVNIQNI